VRSLTPDESALWARVAATIRPLSREVNLKSSLERGGEPAKLVEGPHAGSRGSTVGPLHHGALRRGPPPRSGEELKGTLDGTWDRRLSSGSIEPDRMVDLHGMSLDGAWQAIDRALDQAIARGERVLLLITGHQRSGEPPVRRGAIRAAVHDWLRASRHAGEIASVRAAHRRHGGGGSLYIVLRRKRDRR
jgi:DNA-nicking Smr family endonuclease